MCQWVVWAFYSIWILTPDQIHDLQRSSRLVFAAFSFCWLLHLLCISDIFLMSPTFVSVPWIWLSILCPLPSDDTFAPGDQILVFCEMAHLVQDRWLFIFPHLSFHRNSGKKAQILDCVVTEAFTSMFLESSQNEEPVSYCTIQGLIRREKLCTNLNRESRT